MFFAHFSSPFYYICRKQRGAHILNNIILISKRLHQLFFLSNKIYLQSLSNIRIFRGRLWLSILSKNNFVIMKKWETIDLMFWWNKLLYYYGLPYAYRVLLMQSNDNLVRIWPFKFMNIVLLLYSHSLYVKKYQSTWALNFNYLQISKGIGWSEL